MSYKRLLIVLSLVLSSCSASHYVTKSETFKQKAISKGAIYDSIYKYVTKTDTLIDTLTNTIEVVTYVVDSVPYLVDKPYYVPTSRQERKQIKDSLSYIIKLKDIELDSMKIVNKHVKNVNKQDNKRVKIENKHVRKRSKWWLFLLIGFILGFVTRFL